MSSLPDHPANLIFPSPKVGQDESDSTLKLYPVDGPAGEGWIGLNKGCVAWFSLGELEIEIVQAYWCGPVRQGKGKRTPVSQEMLVAAAKGKGGLLLAPKGTPFQFKVWQQLARIPFGATRSYGEIAKEIGSPNHARAVGAAVGANPIAWLIPCHRVLPANGRIGNYRWGAEAKKQLLTWERSQRGSGLPDLLPDKRQKLEAMLMKAQRFQDIAKMSGDIAHDLNNLLAPIRMATELLKQKNSDDSLNRYVDIIETSTGRARSVIQELLAFSRETEGNQPQLLDVNQLLKELLKISRTTFPKRLKIKAEFEAKSPPVRMDPTQLHRTILNLLVNARDAIGGEGTITVKVGVEDLDVHVRVGDHSLTPGPYVCISVSDTGCGISEDIRERIFDPFFTTKPKEQGTGLGLASVYGIVARSGGFVDLESQVGKGTTFHVFLPQAKD